LDNLIGAVVLTLGKGHEACGEIETAHLGYLGSQGNFYVVSFKGVGRIYQQTYVDTYAKVAHCKLYTNKPAITAASLLNGRSMPNRNCRFCASRPIVERSITVGPTAMITSFIWPSTT
jgi:hypothetical protein